MVRHMDSIKESVTHFNGFVNRQEEKELRHMRLDEEQAIR